MPRRYGTVSTEAEMEGSSRAWLNLAHSYPETKTYKELNSKKR